MTREHLDHPFAPVCAADSRILVLGSFPSPGSRESGFYYGHPGNRFWRVLAMTWNEPVPASVDEKTVLLQKHHIALWDSARHVSILGASDASIRDIIPNQLQPILDKAGIVRILLNGRLSGDIFEKKIFTSGMPPYCVLPSTSAANASWSLDRLVRVWAPMLRGEEPPDDYPLKGV